MVGVCNGGLDIRSRVEVPVVLHLVPALLGMHLCLEFFSSAAGFAKNISLSALSGSLPWVARSNSPTPAIVAIGTWSRGGGLLVHSCGSGVVITSSLASRILEMGLGPLDPPIVLGDTISLGTGTAHMAVGTCSATTVTCYILGSIASLG